MDSKDNGVDNGAEQSGRRGFLSKSAALGLAGVTLGLVACKEEAGAAKGGAAAPQKEGASKEIAPGQLDEYYAFISAGHGGEARVLGLPSGRTLKRIPVFNTDCMVGWGVTNESKAIMGTKADGTLKYTTGDTHHVHGSYKDGTYDGRWLFVNDKIHSRLARIRMDTMECDKIVELPNVMGFHGLFTDKCDPVDTKINYTTRVFCGGEFHIPLPNDGRDLDDPTKWGTLFSCVNAETMELKWQCRIDGNNDLVATSYDGKLAASNQYNTENAADLNGMMAAERDACVFFNIERIEALVKAGKFTTIGGSKVPVVDGRKAANSDPKTSVTCYVPVGKNPHGVNASPDGKYFVCSGKLSPTATVIELKRVMAWFNGELKEPRDAVVAEPEIGLGPLHTAFDGKGNAYTSLFLDSQCVKWNVDAAIAQFKGDKTAKVIIEKMDVHYQPGHNYSSMGETKEADGKYLNSGNKFSKDRFLPVGPLHPETEQLIDISGGKMHLVADHTAYSEPHDGIIVRRDIVKTRQIYNMDDFPNAVKPENAGIERHGNKVHVRLMSQAPAYSMPIIKVKKGDEVTLTLTNHDKVEDLTHGCALPTYNINFIVNPQETKSVTFKADHAGAFWLYCTHFCHALHLEMRSRFLVEA
ncbi:nitrous-oxide reductase [Duganella sp. BJB488]|uniref:TAT-dependent nitrous-oxide reductase n=1 Tax=unclassified Duganella TaxID=2636909 RepID=UPI000E354C69|nr:MULTISPECIES: TAT-dependent nitrous-oxide reductase [unclassified Duganella]NVD73368.1 nitrous-oxide reductase [Duganella sp. BJB1802]RFP21879.1 nitrous-oxide reductase [Duganella sp. BJB489]RFP23671.1 nitrous-oxide reductase [Duganella sp. BJB488]RFP38838.1 nitrous-oxide reductase [Duganella sp. BJB480]